MRRDGGPHHRQYTTQQPLYFAPVLGLSDHHAVTTEATASWGPAGPFPIAVNLGPPDAFKTCSINATPGTDCYYLFDNNQNGNGDFGFLNLARWGQPSDQGCNGGGGANLLSGEITGTVGYSQYVFKIPDYVCQISGLKGKDWNQALASMVGQTRSFPINDPTKTTAKRWYIVGFARMTIVSVDQNAKSCSGLAIDGQERDVRSPDVGRRRRGHRDDATRDRRPVRPPVRHGPRQGHVPWLVLAIVVHDVRRS